MRRRLHNLEIKPWQKKMWCIPKVDAEYVARMEDILDLYAEEPDPFHPIVCFDETPVQLIGESRPPIQATPGQAKRVDYEYRRNGTANLFVFLDTHGPWRHVKVTERRTFIDFAHCMKEIVDDFFPDALKFRVVLDNLSTHQPSALYRAFPADEARRILRRLEVPLHSKACKLAQHGRDRDQRPVEAVPRSQNSEYLGACQRDPGLVQDAQRKRRSYPVALRCHSRPKENGPHISHPTNRPGLRSSPPQRGGANTSKPLCRGTRSTTFG